MKAIRTAKEFLSHSKIIAQKQPHILKIHGTTLALQKSYYFRVLLFYSGGVGLFYRITCCPELLQTVLRYTDQYPYSEVLTKWINDQPFCHNSKESQLCRQPDSNIIQSPSSRVLTIPQYLICSLTRRKMKLDDECKLLSLQ